MKYRIRYYKKLVIIKLLLWRALLALNIVGIAGKIDEKAVRTFARQVVHSEEWE